MPAGDRPRAEQALQLDAFAVGAYWTRLARKLSATTLGGPSEPDASRTSIVGMAFNAAGAISLSRNTASETIAWRHHFVLIQPFMKALRCSRERLAVRLENAVDRGAAELVLSFAAELLLSLENQSVVLAFDEAESVQQAEAQQQEVAGFARPNKGINLARFARRLSRTR